MYRVLVVAAALVLTGCSTPSSEDLPPGLLPTAAPSSAPTETLPEPPIDTLEPDLSTPEGLAVAYMTYRSLGEGENACALMTDGLRGAFGGEATCRSRIEQYGEDVRYDFEDSLDVAANVTTRVVREDGNRVEVAAALNPSDQSDLLFAEGLTVERRGERWYIVDLASLRATQTQDPS